jgi:hypothetical protein
MIGSEYPKFVYLSNPPKCGDYKVAHDPEEEAVIMASLLSIAPAPPIVQKKSKRRAERTKGDGLTTILPFEQPKKVA